MRTIILILMAVFLFGADNHKEVMTINPALIGAWKAVTTSTDKGSTIEDTNFVLCRARELSILLANGNTINVSKVLEMKTKDGKLGNMIMFSNDTVVYAVSDTGVNGLFLLQVFHQNENNDGVTEKIRFLIEVLN